MGAEISQKWHHKIGAFVKYLQQYANRIWYGPVIGFLAGLDNFVIVIPNDGILISSTMLTPKRWFYLALNMAIGSTIGALFFAVLVEQKGLPWILEYYPAMTTGPNWEFVLGLFDKYGLLMVFLLAISPIMLQPIVVLASMAHIPMGVLGLVIFAGRLGKYIFLAYLASHAPRYLSKLWGIKGELKDVGIKLDTD